MMRERHARYCLCGSGFVAIGYDAAKVALEVWWQGSHTGPGHGATTAATAARARRKADRDNVEVDDE